VIATEIFPYATRVIYIFGVGFLSILTYLEIFYTLKKKVKLILMFLIIIAAGYGNEFIVRTKTTKKIMHNRSCEEQKPKRQLNVRTYSRVFEPIHDSAYMLVRVALLLRRHPDQRTYLEEVSYVKSFN
jgi:hypothetical protein